MASYEKILKFPTIKTVGEIFHSLDGQIQDKKNMSDLLIRKALVSSMEEHDNSLDCAFELCLLSLTTAESGAFCSINLPFSMISDLFELLKISQIQEALIFLNKILPRMLKEPFYTAGKYTLLRTCNDLLKRLSSTQDYELCGEIQLILSKIFPLNEKSALNLTSEFNTDKLAYVMMDDPSFDYDPKNYRDNWCNDELFFSKFWEIQECLNDPELILISELSWDKFKTNFESILNAFKSIEYSSSYKNGHSIAGRTFFPKYTANPKLMIMQLEDLEFRQQILLQFYIMINYLKTKGKYQKRELSPKQLEWCSETFDMILNVIEKYDSIYQCNFSQCVNNALKNEEVWSDWKATGCPHIVNNTYDIIPASINTELDFTQWDFSTQQTFDNPRLNQLWNICPDNMEACKTSRREKAYPTDFNSFINEIIESSPKAFLDSTNKITTQSWFQWRALRLLARDSPTFFSAPGCNSVASYLDSIIASNLNKAV